MALWIVGVMLWMAVDEAGAMDFPRTCDAKTTW